MSMGKKVSPVIAFDSIHCCQIGQNPRLAPWATTRPAPANAPTQGARKTATTR